ncbi:hypothetical protein B0H13DRAFT_2300838 [Mycena leptocephala]|nr:hypothetical protein B0H13DRAFT_2300838 [Mycena leptocephala]
MPPREQTRNSDSNGYVLHVPCFLFFYFFIALALQVCWLFVYHATPPPRIPRSQGTTEVKPYPFTRHPSLPFSLTLQTGTHTSAIPRDLVTLVGMALDAVGAGRRGGG